MSVCDEFDGGDSGIDTSFESTESDTSTLDTSLDVDNIMDAGGDDFGQFEDGPIFNRDEFDLLETGYSNVNDILDAKVDDYHDKGFSDDEIADFIAKDKWELQNEFLNDAFPEQDTAPHVFNGFEENGAKTRIDEINNSQSLQELIDYEQISELTETTGETIPDSTFDVNAIMDAGENDFAQFEDAVETQEVIEQQNSDSAETNSELDEPPDVPSNPADVEVIEQLSEDLKLDDTGSNDTVEMMTEAEDIEGVESITDTTSDDFSDVSNQNNVSTDAVTLEASDVAEKPSDESIPEYNHSEVYVASDVTPDSETEEATEAVEQPSADVQTDISSTEMNELNELTPESASEVKQDFPAAELAAEIPKADDTQEWLGEINPNFDPFDWESPYNNNCGSCAFAVSQRLDGADSEIVASVDNIGTIDDMNALTGMEQVAMSPDEIKEYLISQGAGSHGIVGIDRAEGPGHWFNAYYDGERVVAIDGQSGEVRDWPPDYGDVTNWDISIRKEQN